MSLSRYWRLVGISTQNGDNLEISEARLCVSGTIVDSGATFMATLPPSSGVLSDLQDNASTSAVMWLADSYTQPGFALVWDFGVGGDIYINSIKIGSSDDNNKFVRNAILQSSNTGLDWATRFSFNDLVSSEIWTVSTFILSNYSLDVINDVPVRYFRLNDVTGTIAVDSMGNGNGTYSGGVQLNQTGFVFDGKSVLFDETALSKMDCNFNTSYTTFSVEFIFKASETGNTGYPILVGKLGYYAGTVADFPFSISWNPVTDVVVVRLSKGDDYNADIIFTSATLAKGTIYHVVAIIRNSGLCEIYVDGVLSGSINIDFNLSITATKWSVGRANELSGGVGRSGFQGYIGEVAIYDKALTPAQITIHSSDVNTGGGANSIIVSTYGHLREFAFLDIYHGGQGIISGTVKEKSIPDNIPLKRRVFLLDEATRIVIRETWSNEETGTFEFRGIKQDVKYSIISYDYLQNYYAVIKNNLLPYLP